MNQFYYSKDLMTLVDVSSFVFHHIFATKKHISYAKQPCTDAEFEKILIRNYYAKINKLKKQFSNVVFCMDGKLTKSWRHKLFPQYKGRRSHDASIKAYFKLLFDVTMAMGSVVKVKNVECDDIIATLCRYVSIITKDIQYNKKNINVISNDGDFYQLLQLNNVKLFNNKFVEIQLSKKEAKEALLIKIKKGDPSDSIPSAKTNTEELNRILIDFAHIPEAIQTKIMNQFFKHFTCVTTKTKPIIVGKYKKATVVNRPSKKIKSPYLADILIDGKTTMAHTPALGMSGMISSKSTVMVQPICKPKKATHRINLVQQHNEWVGAEPLKANGIVEFALRHNWIPLGSPCRKFDKDTLFKKEFCVEECSQSSRIDFYIENTITTEGHKDTIEKHLIEVKSVILKDDNGVAYFPDGYMKPDSVCVSERALKHVQTLERFCQKPHQHSHLIYIVQRYDVDRFRLYREKDPVYTRAMWKAMFNGMNVHVFKVQWTHQGCRKFKQIPLIW